MVRKNLRKYKKITLWERDLGKKNNEYHAIISKINKFDEVVKELEDEKDDREVVEKEKKKIWNEILRLIESKRQEYIINAYEAQQIVYGINFLIKK